MNKLLVNIVNLVKLIPTVETLIENEIQIYKKIVINLAEIINKIISTFHQISKRTTDSGQFKGFRRQKQRICKLEINFRM